MALPRPPRTILAVEDDPVMRRAIERALCGPNGALQAMAARAVGDVQVRFAATGNEALRALADHAPAFVLLDYVLPDMEAPQVLAAVRAAEHTRTTPVVVFSSVADPSRMRGVLAGGANSWVPKTDDPEAFEAAVRAIANYWLHVHSAP